ncbi:hypothetical protein NST02_14615 [Robertmurraya sp. FSL W8-0741]|uniref:hypothetical protein n=1 Tax=Robertmurraya TaxID=2837507 RepID=UPI0010F95357|nr:hypothetical protein [Robertmurraya siralis]
MYKLNFIDDILEEGSNEVRYYWNDIKDNEQSVDLNIVVNSEAKIIFVEEKNINSKTEVEQIKKSIEWRDSVKKISAAQEIPSEEESNPISLLRDYQVPFKINGGSTRSQFLSDHAFDRHKYVNNAASSCSRSRYAQDVGVKSLTNTTRSVPDEKFTTTHGDNSRTTTYIKKFKGGRTMNMRMSDYGYTDYHRVIISHDYSEQNTHHPYCK